MRGFLLLLNVLMCQNELQIFISNKSEMIGSLDDCSEAYPVADIREAAVTIYEEICWARPDPDVMAMVARSLERVDADYEGAKEWAMAFLDSDQDFDLSVVARRYLLDHFDEIIALARKHPSPISVEVALRAGYSDMVKRSLLSGGESVGAEFGNEDMVMN